MRDLHLIRDFDLVRALMMRELLMRDAVPAEILGDLVQDLTQDLMQDLVRDLVRDLQAEILQDHRLPLEDHRHRLKLRRPPLPRFLLLLHQARATPETAMIVELHRWKMARCPSRPPCQTKAKNHGSRPRQ